MDKSFFNFDLDRMFNDFEKMFGEFNKGTWFSSSTYYKISDEDPLKGIKSEEIETTSEVKDGKTIITKRHRKPDGTEITVTETIPHKKELPEDLKSLKLQLEQAIADQEFEKCAELRDKIKTLEKKSQAPPKE